MNDKDDNKHQKPDDFEFVHIDQDDFLEPNDPNQPNGEPTKSDELDQKEIFNRYFYGFIIMAIISVLLFLMGLLWQGKVNLMTIGNALWITFAIELAVGWIMFVYNRNVLSSTLYGFKSFGLMFVGKRPKQTYYDYYKKVESNPIPTYLYRVVLISSFVILGLAIISLIMIQVG